MSDSTIPPPFLTIAETKDYFASQGFKIGRRTIENAIARELIVARKMMGRLYVERAAVDAYLAALPRAVRKPPPLPPSKRAIAAPTPAPELQPAPQPSADPQPPAAAKARRTRRGWIAA